jgi:menaquinone-dependent protoporphyrinogen oxidase
VNDTDKPKILILYASTHGQTEKIASKLAISMGLKDLDVVTKDVHKNAEESPDGFDAIVLAASIHAGHHQREMVNWVHRNIDSLSARPNAFVSVSLSNAEEDEEARAQGLKYIEDFIRDTRWYPDHTEPVAGALLYREYNPFTRTLMKLIMKKGDHPTDGSHDYEYTDWDELARFGQELSVDFKKRIAARSTMAG